MKPELSERFLNYVASLLLAFLIGLVFGGYWKSDEARDYAQMAIETQGQLRECVARRAEEAQKRIDSLNRWTSRHDSD